MIDTKLIDTLKLMASKERKIKKFKRLLRIKGIIIDKIVTKKDNIVLKVKKEENEYSFTVLKSHKEHYSIAEKLNVGESVSVRGIPKFRINICTSLKILNRSFSEEKQTKLDNY